MPCKVEIPTVITEANWKYIIQGGGPFVQVLGDVGRILVVLSVPFQFICSALEHGGKDVVCKRGEFPFEDFTEKNFETMNYKPSNKSSHRRDIAFLLQGDDDVTPTCFNDLIYSYLLHLMFDAAKEKEVPKEFPVSGEEFEIRNFTANTLGNILQQAVVCVVNIYEEKVL